MTTLPKLRSKVDLIRGRSDLELAMMRILVEAGEPLALRDISLLIQVTYKSLETSRKAIRNCLQNEIETHGDRALYVLVDDKYAIRAEYLSYFEAPKLSFDVTESDEVGVIEEDTCVAKTAPVANEMVAEPKRFIASTRTSSPPDEDEIDFDVDSIVNDIFSETEKESSAVYQIQIRLPASFEPKYKALSPKVKKALREAFGEMLDKAYQRTRA